MKNRPTLFDLWREFRYFADVTDRKYLSHLDFFIEAKAGRFSGSKKSDRRQILLSSLTGLEEDLEKVNTYLFWKRRQFRRLSFTPKSILMAPKAKKDRLVKTPAKVSTPKKTHPPPSTSKMGPCKPIALPTTELKKFQPQLEELGLGFLFWRWDYTAEPLVKEFFLSKSEVALSHREKPHEWTVAHYRRMLGRTKEQEELGIVWDTAIQRLNMLECVNPDDLFEEKRKQNDKNGYKTKTYADPIRRNALKTVRDGSPIYIGAFLAHLHLKNEWLTAEERSLYEEVDPYSKISVDYSSDEDEDDTSDEEEEKTEEAKEVGEVVKDTESDEDEDEGGNKDKAQVEDESPPPSPTSPNYSPDQIVAKPMRGKKQKVLRFRETVAKKKALKETSKEEVNKDKAEEEESEGMEKEAELLTQIIEDGPSQVHTSTPRPSVSINLIADYLSRYFEELTPKLFKATQRTKTAEEEKRVALEYAKLKDQEKASLEDRVKELEGKVEAIEKEKVFLVEEGKKKDKKIKNLQVQWIARQEVEDKEVILGNLRDAVETILANLKETPAKEKKKIAFAQLTEQVKGDYETVLEEHRDDFERFRTSLLSETAVPSTSRGKSSS
ncbi:hypothetical protein R1sor_020845 [Riccia sorocarpa]|uniref:Uncharacterized protein n=1 Tax=Riccia sorocarpa TaxID=122646 RepID=A0ABD3GJK0_9MARC